MVAIGRTFSDRTDFVVCEDHFDLELDVHRRPSDSRYILNAAVLPHRNMYIDPIVSRSGPSRSNVFFNDEACQTDTEEIRHVESQTCSDDLAEIECQALCQERQFASVACQTSCQELQFESVACQTSCQELESDSVACQTIIEIVPSFEGQSTTSKGSSSLDESATSSGSIYQPTLSEIEEADEEEEVDEAEDDEFGEMNNNNEPSSLTDAEKAKICDLSMRLMEQSLSHYTGIPSESSYVIDLITQKSGVSKRNLFLILRKIRHNESLWILGDLFGITRQQAGNIFRWDIEKVATCLQPFIYWPEKSYFKRNLPLQFKHKYKDVEVIIDCFETSILKPGKPLDQALSWSQYKHANTIKYLIGCSPDGMIIFISKGFLGRISDKEIVQRSGFLNFLKKGTFVMADRGFKDVNTEIMLRGGQLIKPPSVTTGVIYTVEEAKLCRSIAATRIHVERVIGNLRHFALLKPYQPVFSPKRAYLLEYAVTVASAICNMQGLLIKI